ncbi:MAG: magnesium transporter CorA family protein [Bacteroidia bacterium]|nr:magnesium transporter CorA family protein [Bacteroidia bacterium]
MLTIYSSENGKLKTEQSVKEGCWINISPPFNLDNLKAISQELDIPLDFLTDSIDIDERSRYEREDGLKLIVYNIPVKNDGIAETEAAYITIPLGIVISQDFILTISSFKNPIIELFENNKIKNFDPSDFSNFVLQIFERSVIYFLNFLKQINKLRYSFEKELYYSSKNEELNNLMNIQKSLVYFVTNLRSNELLMMKMQRTDLLRISGDENKTDLLQDIIVDNSQALEMADIYTKVLNATMDAFASIISNNLNQVVKRLTSVTIVLMVPTLVASFYGMNVKNLPLENSQFAFISIIFISIGLSLLLIWFFIRKRWF